MASRIPAVIKAPPGGLRTYGPASTSPVTAEGRSAAAQTAEHGRHLLHLAGAALGQGLDHVSHLPVLLEQHFGMKSVSTVHGLALSAWAFAGLSGNQLASFVVSHTADAAHRYSALIPIITVLYAIALASIIAVVLGTKGKRAAAQSN